MTNPIEQFREIQAAEKASNEARIALYKANERHNEILQTKFRAVSTFFSLYETLKNQKGKFSKHTGEYHAITEVLHYAGVFGVALPESVISPLQGGQSSHSLNNHDHSQDYVGYILSSCKDHSRTYRASLSAYDWNIYMIQVAYDRFENLHFIGGHGAKTLTKPQWENNISVVGAVLGECLEFPTVVTVHQEATLATDNTFGVGSK